MSNITKNLNIYKDVTNFIGMRSFGKEDLVVPYRQFSGTKVGSLNIGSDFVARGFATGSYIRVPNDTIYTKFEMVVKFKTPNKLSSSFQGITGQITNNKTTPQLEYNTDGAVDCIVTPSTSSDWYGSEVKFNTALNTWYWVKYIWNNGVAELLYSTNGINYTSAGTYEVPSINWSEPMAIGKDQTSSATAFQGWVDLKECYIKVEDIEVWRGVKPTTTISRNDMQNYVLDGITVTPVINDNKAVIDFSNVTLPWKFEHKDKMQTSRFAIAPYDTTVTQQRYEKSLNNTVVGALNISDLGVASGFSSSKYLKPSYQFRPTSGDTWEINFKFKTPDVINSVNYLFQSCKGTGSSGRYGVIVYYRNGSFNFAVSSSGSAWIFDKVGTYQPQPSTVYWLKASFNGSQYKLQYSLDGVTYYDDMVYDSTSALYSNLVYSYIGIYSTSSFENPNLGQIYLSDCYIKINDEEVWRGVKWIDKVFNGNIKGSPTVNIDTMIASNFANTSYIRIPNSLNFAHNSFEMQTKILYRKSSTNQILLGEHNQSYQACLLIDSDGKYSLVIPDSSHSAYLSDCIGNTVLQDGEVYTIKITYNRSVYRAYLNGVLDGELIQAPSLSNHIWNIGSSANPSYSFPSISDIHLTDTYVKIDGQEVFRGAEVLGQETLKGCIKSSSVDSGLYQVYAIDGDKSITLYKDSEKTVDPTSTNEKEWYLGNYELEF